MEREIKFPEGLNLQRPKRLGIQLKEYFKKIIINCRFNKDGELVKINKRKEAK